MIYVVYYYDDQYRKHMAFCKTMVEIKFLQDRFGEVTIESYKI